jgi:6-phosphogluconolactonase
MGMIRACAVEVQGARESKMNARIVLMCAFALTASCGGGGGDGTPALPSKFLYASAYGGPNTFPGAIYGFAVYPGGALSLVPGSPAPTSDGGGPIAITRDSKVLYTTNLPGELLAFQIHADGSLTNAPVPSFSTPDLPVGLVAHPTADFLYASGYSGVLTVFAIDAATGALNLTSSVTLGNEFIKNSAAITPNGRYLYQDDVYPDDVFPTALQIAGFSTNAATGALSPVPGSPLSPTTHSASSPRLMAIDPTGKFLYAGYEFVVVNVGSDGGLAAYSIDAASGALTAVPGSPVGVGGVPNSVAIDASGRFLIVSIFPRLGGAPGNCLAVLSIDPSTGALTLVPGSPFGPMHACGFVAADPSGPYVYAGTALETANTPATVVVLSMDQATGALAPIGETTIPDKLGVSFIALTH